MAFVNIKGATVGDKLGEKGFTLIESWTKQDGTVIKSYYKVWTAEKWNTGSVVDVSGILSVKADIYEGDAKVSISVNNPRINISGAAPVSAAPAAPVVDVSAPF